MDLKPCPFCGNEYISASTQPVKNGRAICSCYCSECGARGPMVKGYHDLEKDAENAWNDRVTINEED